MKNVNDFRGTIHEIFYDWVYKGNYLNYMRMRIFYNKKLLINISKKIKMSSYFISEVSEERGEDGVGGPETSEHQPSRARTQIVLGSKT